MNAEHARETGFIANSQNAATRFVTLHLELVKKTKERNFQITPCLRVANNSVSRAVFFAFLFFLFCSIALKK
jgi:hypothetical protein